MSDAKAIRVEVEYDDGVLERATGEEATEIWRHYSGPKLKPVPKSERDQDLQARLALVLREVAGHFPRLDWSMDGELLLARCNCGAQFSINFYGDWGWIAEWQQHILSLHPDYEKALAEHDAALRAAYEKSVRNANAILDDNQKLEADNAALRELLDWALLYGHFGETEQDEANLAKARALLGEKS